MESTSAIALPPMTPRPIPHKTSLSMTSEWGALKIVQLEVYFETKSCPCATQKAMLGIFGAASTHIWVLGVFMIALGRIMADCLPSAPIRPPAQQFIRRRLLLHFWTPIALKQQHRAGSPTLGCTKQDAFGHLYTYDDKKTRFKTLLAHIERVSNHQTTLRNGTTVPDALLTIS